MECADRTRASPCKEVKPILMPPAVESTSTLNDDRPGDDGTGRRVKAASGA